MQIPYGRQWIDEEDIKAVVSVLKSDYLTTGPVIREFEEAICEYTGAKYAVAFANGTAALHGACYAAGIGEGDEVITTPITFAASANCVLYQKGTPVFADIDPDTYNIDPEDIERKITSRTKAIIPVHFTGQPCDMDRIHQIAQKHNLTVIEDAAHALGATYHGKRIGALSDMTILSFHPVKHITTGEGGMVLTNNEELYRRLVLFHTHGITRNPDMLTKNDGGWYYEQLDLGFNYRITDFQCALGISQLKKLPMFLEKRREIAAYYNHAFQDIEEMKLPYQLEGVDSAWHLYMIQVPARKRKKLYDALREAGILVNVHYIPVYTFPYYREHGYRDVTCVNAERYYERALSLPMFPALTLKEQDYVIDTVKYLLK